MKETKKYTMRTILTILWILSILATAYLTRQLTEPEVITETELVYADTISHTTINNYNYHTTSPTETHYYTDVDTNIVVNKGDCDSIRNYTVKSKTDSIEIISNVRTLGKLYSIDNTYKLLFPTQINKTIVYNTDGFYFGGGLLYFKEPQIGLSLSYIRKKYIYSYNIYTGNIHTLGVGYKLF